MKGLVIITYRDRQTHLDVLVPHLNRFWPHLDICVSEQADNNVWNKGLLYNAAYNEVGRHYDYIILHDVDWVPARTVDYGYCETPTMIGGAASQFNYRLLYAAFFGGVVVCSKDHYEYINGFSNSFRGYGGEDDDLRRRFIGKGIQTGIKMCRFECFHHPRPDIKPGGQYYTNNDYQHNLEILKQPIDYNDGLSSARYTIVSKGEYPECTHLKIATI